MLLFPRVVGTVAAVALLGCAPDESIGPRVAPGVVVTDANAAKSIGGSAKIYCNGTTCFAAEFDFTDIPGHTIFTATIQNLEGTYPPGGPNTVQRLNRFHFQFFDDINSDDRITAVSDYRSFIPVGNVRVGVNNVWGHDEPIGGPSAALFTVNGGGIVGCAGAVHVMAFHFQTCPSQGLDGWVTVGFKLRHTGIAAKKSPVRFKDFRFTFGDQGTARCTIGGNQPGTCTEVHYKQAMRN